MKNDMPSLGTPIKDRGALGVRIRSTKDEAIQAAEGAALTVEPGGWDDNRTGGADLYRRFELIQMMKRQPSLSFGDSRPFESGRQARLGLE